MKYFFDNNFREYGILGFKDGLTFEILKQQFPWVLEAKIKDAVLGIQENYLSWHNGTWYSGWWLNGNWKNGVWLNGTWYNGYWIKGIRENGIWIKGVWKDGIWLNGIFIKGKRNKGTWKNIKLKQKLRNK